jgi:putative membrane protein
MMYYWNGNWGGMLLAMLLNGVVLVGLIGLVIWAVSRFVNQRPPSTWRPDGGPSAMEILRQRYARGEIDDATFERMRAQLHASGAHDPLSTPPER